MHSHRKTLPQRPKKQATATTHTSRRAQTSDTSQGNVFMEYLPSLHLSNHTPYLGFAHAVSTSTNYSLPIIIAEGISIALLIHYKALS